MEDPDPQLRKTAFYNVKNFLEKTTLDTDVLKNIVCVSVVRLSNFPIRNNEVDHYSNAIELMALLATLMGGNDFCPQVLERFIELCQHGNYMVRRWSTDYFPVFCYVLGEVSAEKLLPIFTLLCEDTAWSVRKSAAKALPKVALTCSLQRRRDTLAPIAFNLLNDLTRFVSESAFKNLGQFIATFAQPCAIELAYGTSGKLYITSKANDTKSQNSFTEENTFPTTRSDESGSILDSTDTNPYRKFLIGETFSVQSGSLMDQQNINAQQFHSVYSRIFNSIKRDPVESKTFVRKQQDQQQLNDTIVDDDDTSSGCSSGPCSDSGDDNRAIEELTFVDVAESNTMENLVGHMEENFMENVEDNLEENFMENVEEKKEFLNDEEYVDDFNDNFSNEILNKLPDGLRELMAQIRETTNSEIRRRNKDARVILMLTAEERLNRRKAEIRFRMFGQVPAEIPPSTLHHSHYPNGDLKTSFKIFPWQKKIASQPESNTMVIDNTNVTLRRKGTSQINEDENVPTRTEADQPTAQPQPLNENEDIDVDELAEFNGLNFWREDLGTIDVDKEVGLLKERELKKAQEDYIKSLTPVSPKLVIPMNPDFVETLQANEPPDDAHKQKVDKLKAKCVGPTGDPNMSFFNQPIVPPYLIEYFASVELFSDSDFNMYCVYNFPAVVLTLQKENWHLTYDLLLYLTSDIQWKVRKTIAMFICEIALIIGRENTHRDLLPIFLGFFKDLDEVKIEALKNLPTFLSVIDIEEHAKVIANLGECLQCDNDSNWRFREELARQLLHLIATYGRVYCINYLIWVTGMAIALLTDKVSAVRTVAMEAIAEKCCTSSPIELKYLVEFLVEDFARHVHWRRRQMFLNICELMIKKPNSPPFEVIERDFLQPILSLAKDTIPNIRLAVGRLLSLLFSYHPHLLTQLNHPMTETLIMLQCDGDNDVKFVANDR
ncbi:hypothetical protein HA402_015915 [Bradysia odoriphaga]|nr:hypothetical protein HA402_015915 [Bradysia odoriphaga]